MSVSTRARIRAGALAFALIVGLGLVPPAQAQMPPAGPAPKWGPFLDLGGKAGTERNLGEGDLFVPLWQNDVSLLFGDVRTKFDDRGSLEGNFGLGFRHMLPSGWNLGTYGYFDRRRSTYGNHFDQVTIGGEALSLDWDFRANAYIPVGRRTVAVPSLNTATLSGTTIVFGDGTEKSLGGFDAEVGWRVPLFAPDANQQLRVYAGGYRFAAAGAPTVAGPRGRIDLTVDQVPGLWPGARLELGAEVEHDSPRGTQAFADFRIRIPFQVFTGAAVPRLSPMERRMTDPVVRDVDIVTQAGDFTTETATETASGQPITVLSSASTTGANLPTAVTNAGANSTVILSGSFTTAASLTLQSGQTVMGAGSVTVRAPSGRTATLTTPSATITGNLGSTNYTVTMANNSTLSGMVINNTSGGGLNNALDVEAMGVSGASIIDNTLNATDTGGNPAHGVDVGSGSSNVTVSGNTITANAGGGANAYGVQVNGASATVTGNTLSASGGTSTNATVFLSNANILPGSSGNTAVAGSCDVFTGGTGGTVTFTNAAPCGP